MSDGTFKHIPVLLSHVLRLLDPKPGECALDLTLGGAGHASRISEAIGPTGTIFALDRDPDALRAGTQRLEKCPAAAHTLLSPFSQLDSALRLMGAKDAAEGGGFDVILADLGVSSHQLDCPERGFSFASDAPLDMRMSQSGETAAEMLERLEPEAIADILYLNADIRQSRSMARLISAEARLGHLQTTTQLAELCERLLGRPKPGQIHPATRVFQALRIAVNGEFDEIDQMLNDIPKWCKNHTRLGIISFHSGEDRRIKQKFKDWTAPCTCPKSLPVCVCHRVPLGHILTPKPIGPDADEERENPRSRSAKLRVFEFLRQ